MVVILNTRNRLGRPGRGACSSANGSSRCQKNGGGWPAQVHVYVDDVDAHYAQAQAAGAEIRLELHDTEYGDRRYDAYDREGHLWSFATHVRDMPPSDWGAETA